MCSASQQVYSMEPPLPGVTGRTVLVRYVWSDDEGNMRDKLRVLKAPPGVAYNNPECFPLWNFDGSSTGQAVTKDSEILLHPVKVYESYLESDKSLGLGRVYIVLCACSSPSNGIWIDSRPQHASDDLYRQCWFGFEQEYYLYGPTQKLLAWENMDSVPEINPTGVQQWLVSSVPKVN